jgi:hypothetical protein
MSTTTITISQKIPLSTYSFKTVDDFFDAVYGKAFSQEVEINEPIEDVLKKMKQSYERSREAV